VFFFFFTFNIFIDKLELNCHKKDLRPPLPKQDYVILFIHLFVIIEPICHINVFQNEPKSSSLFAELDNRRFRDKP